MSCFVYIISAVSDGRPCAPVKIGVSDSPAGRLASIRTSSPLALSLYATAELTTRIDAMNVEAALHKQNAALRLNGEWFNIEPGAAKWHLCDAVGDYLIDLGYTPRQAGAALESMGIYPPCP